MLLNTTHRGLVPAHPPGSYFLWLLRPHFLICILPLTLLRSVLFRVISWWCHQMETFSALLAICAGNSPVPAQRPVTRSFDVFFDLRPNKRLSKQPWGWWFETPSHPLWRHRNVELYLNYIIRLLFQSPLLKDMPWSFSIFLRNFFALYFILSKTLADLKLDTWKN